MSLGTSRTTTRLLCWLSTGNAAARPDACPALHLTWRASPKPNVSTRDHHCLHRDVADVVTGFDGFVAKYMGDGVLIYFGYPRVHEDDAERAVRAGLLRVL